MTIVEGPVVAEFPDGSVIRRYPSDSEYWHEWPLGRMIPAEHLKMKQAADRVAWRGGEVVLGVQAAKRFYAAVEAAKAEKAETEPR